MSEETDCVITTPYFISCLSLYLFYSAYIDVLVQDCSISIANALEILQSCTKPSIYRPFPDIFRHGGGIKRVVINL